MSRSKLWMTAFFCGAGLFSRVAAFGAAVELQLRQPDGAPLAEAVLAAFPLEGRSPPASAAIMDQRGRKFIPHILPVQVGARVNFPNADSVSHHVYSFSAAKRFQLYLLKGASEAVVFDRPGVVTLGCNLHDWMLAYIRVLDTHYFTQTDVRGRAVLTGLPAGRYRLEVWHPRVTDGADGLARQAALDGKANETWELRLARPLLPARDQKPRFADY